jgi:hypothetical protein
MTKEWAKVKVPVANKYSQWALCSLWCSNNFGPGFTVDRVWEYAGEGIYEFKNDQDAILFSLRWS